ncbi:hypothetical protein DA075_33515 [Methylobacterium currus]|uniref:Uncharacterized protein n=1 Tax=Methylobacterium currus TaxID=2051553 RepID=A0A2R4WW44_9HYPH|nr:hypothetical protein [Methylobacterium currus]AWB25753.1 hypothetical protein DA075_33515 [Methylobacterium currus]UHC19471.1 hypothetical protein LRS73_31960 [Methylobacterium currus]
MLNSVGTIISASMGAVAVTLVVSCTDAAPVTLPDPPAPIARPAEYAFGDVIASLDNRAAKAAQDALRPSFGRGIEVTLIAPASTNFTALARWYETRAQEAGWQPIADFTARLGRGRHGFAYSRGERAFAMVWIDATAPDGSRPVTVIRLGWPG